MNGSEREQIIHRKGLQDHARDSDKRLNHCSAHALGHYLTEQGCKDGVKVKCDRDWRRGWEFPSLKLCREAWKKRFPNWKWRDPTLSVWRTDGDPDINSCF